MRLRTISLLLATAGFGLSPFGMAAESVRDAKRGISFTIPDGFLEAPSGTLEPIMSLKFVRGQLDHPGYAVLVVASRGGTIGRDKLDPKTFEKAARDSVRDSHIQYTKFDFREINWKGFKLDLVISQATQRNRTMVTLSTQVPLEPEAIQFDLGGPPEDESKLLAELSTLLGSLDGKSNWLSDANHRKGSVFNVARLFVSGAAGAVMFFIIFAIRRRSPRPNQRT